MSRRPIGHKRQNRAIGPNEKVFRVIELLEQEPRVGSVIVHENKRFVGIVTRRDLNFLTKSDLDPVKGLKVDDVMTKYNLIAAYEGVSK